VHLGTEALDDGKIKSDIFADTQGIDNTILIEISSSEPPTATLD